MLGVTITKVNGVRIRTAIRSMMHPYRGREWWPCEDSRADYLLGDKPNYQVPSTICYVPAGLASGLADIPDGKRVTWIYYDHPLPNGELCCADEYWY